MAIVPALLVLLLWKVRGLGQVPAFALEQAQVAAGPSPLALDLNLDRYLDLDFEHWRGQMDALREFFWSQRLAQWAPFAGLIAVLSVRRGAIAALLGGWLAAFLVVKGFSPLASIESGSFWRLLMPAWPAYLLLFASIPLLVPTLAKRLGERVRPTQSGRSLPAGSPSRSSSRSSLPASRSRSPHRSMGRSTSETVLQDFESGTSSRRSTSASSSTCEPEGASRRLTWTGGGSWRADVFYRVYRHDGPGDDTTASCPSGSPGTAI